MRYNVIINQEKCRKHGLTAAEGALMDLCNQLVSWAKEEIINGKAYYFISRGKVIEELPFFFSKTDTVYRAFKSLSEKKLLEFRKQNRKDYIRLTKTGKAWNKFGNFSEFKANSEKNPSKLGKISEFENIDPTRANSGNLKSNSEKNPTYNIYNNISDKGVSRARTRGIDFLKEKCPARFEQEFLMPYKKQILDFKKFCEDFEDTVDGEELKFTENILLSRIRKYARNWIQNQGKYSPSEPEQKPAYLRKIN